MEKGICFILIAVLLSLPFVFADTIDNLDQLKDTNDKIEDNLEIAKNPELIREKYLNKEWFNLLNKSNSTYIKTLLFVIKHTSPFSKAILGINISFSWIFVFSLIIWIGLFFFLTPPLSEIFRKKSLGLLASFLIASLIGMSGVIKKSAEMLSFIIKNTWIASISLILAILIVFILKNVGFNIGKNIKNSREKAAKEKLEQDRKIIHSDAKIAKQDLDSYSDSSKDT